MPKSIIDKCCGVETPARREKMAQREKKLRVGVVGAGWVTQYHLPAWLEQTDRVELVAIADPSEEQRAQRQAEFGVPRTYSSAADMLDAEQLDIVDICAPREAHADLVRLAAARGLAILCQKPLAPTLSEAEELVAAVGGSARLMVHENWRFRATYRMLKQWLEAGDAGEIKRVQLDFLSSGTLPDRAGDRPALVRQPFFQALPRLIVSEVLIHHLDALRFLFGELELVSSVLVHSTDAVVGEDGAVLNLRRLSDGLPIRLIGDMAVHGAPAQPRDQLVITGDRATITLDGWQLSLSGAANRLEEFDADATYRGSYSSTIAHFLDALEGGGPFETGPEDNLKTLALVEAAYSPHTKRGDGSHLRG